MTNFNSPLVTVLTPTYNRSKFIKETIESVLIQSFPDFEYLILDDGSTDNSIKIIEPYLSDRRVKYSYHNNVGEAETVNLGWNLAQGKYFTQVNSDDPLYPGFLRKMVGFLEKNTDKVLAYPDFNYIDENSNIKKVIKGRKWDFQRNIANFSCECAGPGTMIRKSSFRNWKKIRSNDFLYINDIEMFWNMALVGDFLHVPYVLANWRVHAGQLSTNIYKSIPECEEWFKRYFERKDLPQSIKKLKPRVRKSLCNYYLKLISESDVSLDEKKQISAPYKTELGMHNYDMLCLQFGDNDLMGNKFNGHDLHIYLRKKNIDATHIVCKKYSSDEYTYEIKYTDAEDLFFNFINNKFFLSADVIHLHLIHNTKFFIEHLPILSSLKPIVWTLHDPWALGGHCIHHGNCMKWQSHCCDCQYLGVPFSLKYDTTALNFEIKKRAIQDSNIHGVVASKWMQDKVNKSPIWKGKPIHLVPFGINQKLFSPRDVRQAKTDLNIDPNMTVLFTRTQPHFKGLEILKETLLRVSGTRKIVLLTVGEKGLLPALPASILHKDYGWLNDDAKMASLYQACDLFLMPSEQETFGMMAIEAMSCGKMVLALDVSTSALPEIINAPQCGISSVRENYPEELLRLFDSPDEIAHRGYKSLVYAQENYDKEKYITKIIQVYKEAINDFVLTKNSKLILDQLRMYSDHVEPLSLTKFHRTGSISAFQKNFSHLKQYYQNYGVVRTCHQIIKKIFK